MFENSKQLPLQPVQEPESEKDQGIDLRPKGVKRFENLHPLPYPPHGEWERFLSQSIAPR